MSTLSTLILYVSQSPTVLVEDRHRTSQVPGSKAFADWAHASDDNNRVASAYFTSSVKANKLAQFGYGLNYLIDRSTSITLSTPERKCIGAPEQTFITTASLVRRDGASHGVWHSICPRTA
jgi:hypothetical protein